MDGEEALAFQGESSRRSAHDRTTGTFATKVIPLTHPGGEGGPLLRLVNVGLEAGCGTPTATNSAVASRLTRQVKLLDIMSPFLEIPAKVHQGMLVLRSTNYSNSGS